MGCACPNTTCAARCSSCRRPRSANMDANAMTLGRQLAADGVLYGTVTAYRERVGYDYAAQDPRRGRFTLHFVDVHNGGRAVDRELRPRSKRRSARTSSTCVTLSPTAGAGCARTISPRAGSTKRSTISNPSSATRFRYRRSPWRRRWAATSSPAMSPPRCFLIPRRVRLHAQRGGHRRMNHVAVIGVEPVAQRAHCARPLRARPRSAISSA